MPLENLYFRHEFNARNDHKLTKLKMKLGMEGIGIYWCLVEYLYERDGFMGEEDIETFCFNERIEEDKVRLVLELAGFKHNKQMGYYLNGVLERIAKREEYILAQKNKANKRWNNKNAIKETCNDLKMRKIMTALDMHERKTKALKQLDELYAKEKNNETE